MSPLLHLSQLLYTLGLEIRQAQPTQPPRRSPTSPIMRSIRVDLLNWHCTSSSRLIWAMVLVISLDNRPEDNKCRYVTPSWVVQQGQDKKKPFSAFLIKNMLHWESHHHMNCKVTRSMYCKKSHTHHTPAPTDGVIAGLITSESTATPKHLLYAVYAVINY